MPKFTHTKIEEMLRVYLLKVEDVGTMNAQGMGYTIRRSDIEIIRDFQSKIPDIIRQLLDERKEIINNVRIFPLTANSDNMVIDPSWIKGWQYCKDQILSMLKRTL